MPIPINAELNFVPVASFPVSPVQGQVCVLSSDGHLYCYDGSQWVDCGQSGGSSAVEYVSGFTTSDYYDSALANPFAGETLITVAGVAEIAGATGQQTILSSLAEGNGSGLSLRINTGYQCQINARLAYSGGVISLNGTVPFGYVGKLLLCVAVIDVSGADLNYEVWANGVQLFNGSVGGGGGALPAGSGSANLRVGIVGDGSFPEQVADGLRIYGAGYRFGTLLSYVEHQQWFLDCRAAGMLVDAPAALTRGWQVNGDPGATWAPFVGSGNLTETGSVTYGTESPFSWL